MVLEYHGTCTIMVLYVRTWYRSYGTKMGQNGTYRYLATIVVGMPHPKGRKPMVVTNGTDRQQTILLASLAVEC